MSRRVRILLAVALLLVAGGSYVFYKIWWVSPRGIPAATGDKAKDFALPDTAGATVTLNDLLVRGPAVLVFYRGYW